LKGAPIADGWALIYRGAHYGNKSVHYLLGRLLSWFVLLSVPLASAVWVSQPVLGHRAFEPMWDVMALIVAIVFAHGVVRVDLDE